jgi:hypothetical protein
MEAASCCGARILRLNFHSRNSAWGFLCFAQVSDLDHCPPVWKASKLSVFGIDRFGKFHLPYISLSKAGAKLNDFNVGGGVSSRNSNCKSETDLPVANVGGLQDFPIVGGLQ